MDFMDSMFSWWQGGIQTAGQGARETEKAEKAEGRAEREGTEGHNAYFRKVIEETNRRAGAKA